MSFDLSRVPRITLARTPTPLEQRRHISDALGVELWFKRDDLTGATLSGNKIRKLEFLLAEAKGLGADTVITCGGEQSNHCRATAIAAAELGMKSVLMLRTEDPNDPPAATANILLDRLVGAEIVWVSREEYKKRAERFVALAEVARARGTKPYVIPEGGSNSLGSLGYIACVEEIARALPPGPATIVYAAGSGGTGAGLILGVKALALPWRVVGVNVCDDRAYFVRAIGEIVEDAISRFAIDVPFSREEVEIVDGYVGAGYAKSQPAELESLRDLARMEGLILDPVYTGKAFYGLRKELALDPMSLGARVVFVHTGGVFGLFPKADEFSSLL